MVTKELPISFGKISHLLRTYITHLILWRYLRFVNIEDTIKHYRAMIEQVLVLEPSSITKALSSEGCSLDETQRRELWWYTGGVYDGRKSEGIIGKEKV